MGKSTLLNALTGAGVSVNDSLFETLDPTTRSFDVDGRRYLVTDTVGFIRRLPHQLVEGFAATLEETLVADIVLHVADASVPEERLDQMLDAVVRCARRDRRGRASGRARPEQDRRRRRAAAPAAREPLSRTRCRSRRGPGRGWTSCARRVAERFAERFEPVRLLIPYADGARLAELYALGAPVDERADRPEGVFIRARLPRSEVRRFAPYLIAEPRQASARSRA